jgi:hypothetical protein
VSKNLELNGWRIAWILLSLIYLAICIGVAITVTAASVPPPDPRVVIVLTLMCWTAPRCLRFRSRYRVAYTCVYTLESLIPILCSERFVVGVDGIWPVYLYIGKPPPRTKLYIGKPPPRTKLT